MKKKTSLSEEDQALFRQLMTGTRQIKQDTIVHKYVRSDVSHFELKKLRRGDYSPELFLDLHGLTQQQAKQELGALIAACRREHVFCACVMHGHGKHILKQQTPLWLAQHPHIMAFHQAPKEYGGDAAGRERWKLKSGNRRSFRKRQPRRESDSLRHLQIAGAHLPVEFAFAAGIKRDAGNRRSGEHRGSFPRAQL